MNVNTMFILQLITHRVTFMTSLTSGEIRILALSEPLNPPEPPFTVTCGLGLSFTNHSTDNTCCQ